MDQQQQQQSPTKLQSKQQNGSGSETRKKEKINIVIPMGRIPESFAHHGYTLPICLNTCVGHPLLLWTLENLSPSIDHEYDCTLWLIRQGGGIPESILSMIRKEHPSVKIEIISLLAQTQGVAETLLACLMRFSKDDLQYPIVSIDSGIVVLDDVIPHVMRHAGQGRGTCFAFEVDYEEPSLSYITFDRFVGEEDSSGVNIINEIQEKMPFSKYANAGIYAFPKASLLVEYCAKTVDSRYSFGSSSGSAGKTPNTPEKSPRKSDPKLGGLYMSSVITKIMESKAAAFAAEILNTRSFYRITKPSLFQSFIENIKNGSIPTRRRVRFCFDLDTIVLNPPTIENDLTSCTPKYESVELLRELFHAGHIIVLQSTRNASRYCPIAKTNVGSLTFSQLRQYDIPFHEIYFGKPDVDIMVDQKSVSNHFGSGDARKIIGWTPASGSYMASPPAAGGDLSSSDGSVATMIKPREFNNIAYAGNKIIKKMSGESAAGEAFFYRNIPQDIVDLFPAVHDVSSLPTSNGFTITIDYVSGVSYAQLSQMCLLTHGRIEKLISSIHRIHSSSGAPEEGIQIDFMHRHGSTPAADASKAMGVVSDLKTIEKYSYLNYATKLRRRYQTHQALYEEVGKKLSASAGSTGGVDSDRPHSRKRNRQDEFIPSNSAVRVEVDVNLLFKQLDAMLQQYETNKSASIRHVIHGDPVFSNVLLNSNEETKFIDMRGMLGNDKVSLGGDCTYDLGKILQSLYGYDFVLLSGKPPDDQETQYLKDLQKVALQLIRKYYPDISVMNVLLITASLMFSLIPLHTDENIQMWALAKSAQLVRNIDDLATLI